MVTSSQSNYLSLLDESWQQHLAPRQPNAPTVISTFAGGGGSSLGYSMAGYRELLAVEWDDNAVATFSLNFPDVPVYHGDIAQLSIEHALDLTGLMPGELDVLDGSPPCQGFSTVGLRIMNDPRNQLFREYVRLLRGLQPKVFVMENVSGLVKGKMKLVFADILRELKASGYRVSVRLMNAMYFNVPQSRQRLIFIGVRGDLGIESSHPDAQSLPIGIPCDHSATERYLSDHEQEVVEAHKARHLLRGNGFGYQLLSEDRPSPTLIKTQVASCAPLWREGDRLRAPSLNELHWIGSYPTQFRFIDYNNAWAIIGNSVPPLFMRAIAQHIRDELLHI